MRIYVSGSRGLVGSAVVKELSARGHKIIYTLRKHDLLNPRDLLDLETLLRCTHVDMVIHCAGKVGGIKANSEDNEGFYEQNFEMGENIVKAAKEAGVKYFINLASTCAYPTNVDYPLKEEDFFKEDAEYEPTNKGYALAKMRVARLVKNQFKDKGITLIPCNVYGVGDRYFKGSHVIPDLIQKFVISHHINCNTMHLYGSGRQEREFINSYDLAKVISKVVSYFHTYDCAPYDLLNVANPYYKSIMEVATYIASLVGWEGTIKWTGELGGIKKKPTDLRRMNHFIKDYDFEYTNFIDGLKEQITDYKELINND